jgi:Zn-dependent alcohol dehydrogenase
MTHPLIEAFTRAVLDGYYGYPTPTEETINAYEIAEDNLTRALAVGAQETLTPDAVREVLERIIRMDQRERKVCINTDLSGNTCVVETIDGPCGEVARIALTAISSPQAQETRYPLREAMLRGCMSACTGDGEHQIKINFETLEDMQEARRALYHALRQEPVSKESQT